MMSAVSDFCRDWDLPKEAIKSLESAFSVLREGPGWSVFESSIAVYKENMEFDHMPVFEEIESLREKTGIHPYTLDLLYLICLVPLLKQRYLEQHLPLEFFYDSVSDLKWKAIECKNVYGVWGIFVGWWTIGFFKCRRFGIGRLQFNKRTFQKSYDVSGIRVREGDLYLDTHIPSGSPLLYEQCRESYRRAAEFFKDDFENGTVLFGCRSWLLSPNNRLILPPSSHILSFMQDYLILEEEQDEKNGNLWRIFNTFSMPDDPEKLPQETSLQRAFVRWLKAGKSIDSAFGVFPWKC